MRVNWIKWHVCIDITVVNGVCNMMLETFDDLNKMFYVLYFGKKIVLIYLLGRGSQLVRRLQKLVVCIVKRSAETRDTCHCLKIHHHYLAGLDICHIVS